MNKKPNLTLLLVPGVIGLLAALAVVGWWVSEIMQRTWRTSGTSLDKYSVTLPAAPKTTPAAAFYCDPAYSTRWAVCNFK